MIFLIDAQLPVAMARWLVAKGHNALHVSGVGMTSASDEEIWNYATAHGAIIVTKGEDFANRRILASGGRLLCGSDWAMRATML